MSEDYTRADRDLGKGHPVLQQRWTALKGRLLTEGYPMWENEVYRPELRQQWLWGAGRSVNDVVAKGLPHSFARPLERRVTNAWSARLSAHGCTRTILIEDGEEKIVPAAAAMDLVPVGKDEKPWTPDDEWTPFVVLLATVGPEYGLVHFHAPGKEVSDKPHLQLVEWSDRDHTLHL